MAAMIREIEVHPAAAEFPEMPADELDKLVESIRRHGIRVPVVFCDGKLLDGRNRFRAAVVLGIPTQDIPKVKLPPDADPYAYAWDANCERLDYSPGKKAEIRLRIEEASGEWARRLEEARVRANEKRAEKAEGNKNAAKEKSENSGAPVGARPSRQARTSAESHPTAAALAKAAGVSQRTMERAMAKTRRPGEQGRLRKARAENTTWRVPRGITDLASFLRARLTSRDRRKLADLLLT